MSNDQIPMTNELRELATTFLLLIEEEPCSGAWNMAVDEALLETARETGLSAVRFYRWDAPTLSLGYFQKRLSEDLPAELRELKQVRRLSGGGAILHHHEWTYSCALPPAHPVALNPVTLYELIHRAIVEWLNEHDIPAALRGELSEKTEPFLCFGRQDPRDIVLGAHKIVGSAQRRRKGAVLQHGSLLLKRSPYAPIYPGLWDLAEREIPLAEELPKLAGRIVRSLGFEENVSAQAELPASLREMAKVLEQERYQTAF